MRPSCVHVWAIPRARPKALLTFGLHVRRSWRTFPTTAHPQEPDQTLIQSMRRYIDALHAHEMVYLTTPRAHPHKATMNLDHGPSADNIFRSSIDLSLLTLSLSRRFSTMLLSPLAPRSSFLLCAHSLSCRVYSMYSIEWRASSCGRLDRGCTLMSLMSPPVSPRSYALTRRAAGGGSTAEGAPPIV